MNPAECKLMLAMANAIETMERQLWHFYVDTGWETIMRADMRRWDKLVERAKKVSLKPKTEER